MNEERPPRCRPLPAHVVESIAAVEPFPFDRIYGFMSGLVIMEGGKAAVARSADRYLEAIGANEAPRCRVGVPDSSGSP